MAMRKILVDETNRELCEHGTVGFPMTVNHDDLWAFEGKSVPIHWHNDLEISLPRGNGTGSDSGKHTSDADIDNGSEAVSDKEMQQAMIYVDVCGAVANPGVFQLAAGSRVFQAIEAAGGYLPEAALTCVNRAGVLTDGQQLYILTQEEMEWQGLDPAEMAGASDGQMNGSAGTGQNTGMTAQVQQDNRININTADEAQLTTLTGIGATRAQAIIAYREENGPFAPLSLYIVW